ncbi:MAG TPA: Sir2 family NAD-dependent protein deacetylase [Prolixibacteraceae bacterium]|jgi:NAD-dependent deacetylase|nr:Sir2 family NAD-dependent protein deacetylase [Prolixibacteraceae bacterium]HPJ77603.1 Sir2 family NAD-dependent protein deacetylase [Prolixibacteraceae bacterium]HRV88502.1 Sir2 family NAD-dependent protein deacetylase [Prolixibacteraceae bacterium]
MENNIGLAARVLRQSSFNMAFTGAGISVESGIPPFRGENGLWNRYDPEVLDINYFMEHGAECWKTIREIFYDYFGKAQPNSGHLALAEMERKGWLQAIVTQNIDGLHQKAGNHKVFEFHGGSGILVCPKCASTWTADETDLENLPPRCKYDGQILKPNFVFFGEGIPTDAWNLSFDSAAQCEVCLIVGSTGEVVPASFVPRKARDRGAYIIEINPERSQFTDQLTDLWLRGNAGDILPQLLLEMGKI